MLLNVFMNFVLSWGVLGLAAFQAPFPLGDRWNPCLPRL